MDTHTQNARERLNTLEQALENVSIILDSHTKAIDDHGERLLGHDRRHLSQRSNLLLETQRRQEEEKELWTAHATAIRYIREDEHLLHTFLSMGFWARLRWVFTGKCK